MSNEGSDQTLQHTASCFLFNPDTLVSTEYIQDPLPSILKKNKKKTQHMLHIQSRDAHPCCYCFKERLIISSKCVFHLVLTLFCPVLSLPFAYSSLSVYCLAFNLCNITNHCFSTRFVLHLQQNLPKAHTGTSSMVSNLCT